MGEVYKRNDPFVIPLAGIRPSNQQNVIRLAKEGAWFEATVDDGQILISESARPKPPYQLIHVVESGNLNEEALRTLVESLSRPGLLKNQGLDLADFETRFLQAFPKDKPLGVRLYNLLPPFFYATPAQTADVFRVLTPHLSQLAEVSDVWFVARPHYVDSRLVFMRLLDVQSHTPEVLDYGPGDFKGFQTLRNLDSTASLGISSQINVFLSLFQPYLLGTSFDQSGGTYVLLLKKPRTYTVPFPARLQDLMRSDYTLFAEDKPIAEKSIFPQCVFSPKEIAEFLHHFVERWNALEHRLLAPHHFVSADGVFDPRAWHLTYITNSRLFTDAAIIQTEYLSQYIRKIIGFRLLDSLAQIIQTNTHSPGLTEKQIFCKLCADKKVWARLGRILSGFPGPFGNYFRNQSKNAQAELKAKVLSGIYVKGAKRDSEVIVGGQAIPEEEYVGLFLREVRNTQHGYRTRRFDVLQIHNGNMPDCFSDIVKLLLLAYIESPQDFFDGAILCAKP